MNSKGIIPITLILISEFINMKAIEDNTVEDNHIDDLTNKQKESLGKLWKAFDYNKSAIARAANVNQSTVIHWFTRGRISAIGAINLDGHEKLKGVLTKEDMRPDVKEWFGV